MTGMNGNIPEIVKFANKAEHDTDQRVRDGAAALIKILRAEGVDVHSENAAPIPDAPAAPVAAKPVAKPQAPTGAKIPEEVWIKFQIVATDVVGPIASRVIAKIKSTYPNHGPLQLKSKFEEAFGKESSDEVFAAYRG